MQMSKIRLLKSKRIEELKQKKKIGYPSDLMQQVNPKPPEVMGCAYVVPLNQMSTKHYGMSRDDEVEKIAMDIANEFEIKEVELQLMFLPIMKVMILSVSRRNKRYIEVKGRSQEGGVMVSENEMNRLINLVTVHGFI